MKTLTIFLLLTTFSVVVNAQKYIAKNGHIWFYSHTPVEDIEAHNRQAASILDPASGDLTFKIAIKSFEFKVALMQEHFNENYMESDKFPKAEFKGAITNNDKVNYSKDGIYTVEIKGDITIHGVTKPVSATGTLEVKGESITGKSKFVIAPREFGIKIPALVESKIAKEVDVNVDINYTPYKP